MIFLPDVQFQNITQATITGTEFEATYDCGGGFARVAATRSQRRERRDRATLVSVPPDRIGGTLAFRFLEQRLTAGSADRRRREEARAGRRRLPRRKPYGLVDAFASYRHNDYMRFDFVVRTCSTSATAVSEFGL